MILIALVPYLHTCTFLNKIRCVFFLIYFMQKTNSCSNLPISLVLVKNFTASRMFPTKLFKTV